MRGRRNIAPVHCDHQSERFALLHYTAPVQGRVVHSLESVTKLLGGWLGG
jgi:hypothetical protein